MAVAITVDNVDATQQGVIIEGRLTFSGNYATGGDTVNLSTIPQIPSDSNPRGMVEIDEQPANGTLPAGYMMWLIAGTTLANWKVWIATAVGQPPTELGAGAYPAALAASTVQFRAFFNYGV